MRKAWLVPLLLVPAAVAPFAFGGCEVTVTCEDGACAGSAIASTGSGATTGVGGGPPCIQLSTDPDTQGFPVDVYSVLKKNCHSCHVPDPNAPMGKCCFNNAPQPFLTYEQTQEQYYTLPLTWWSQIREHAVKNLPASMPFMQPPIPDCEKAILTAWFDTCGADDEAGKCARGPSTSSSTVSSSSSSSSSSSASSGSGSSSSTGP